MGWAKYHEDDLHIYYDRIFTNGVIDIDNHKKKISNHRCPYCDVIFATKKVMFSHIRQVHSITGPLLFINGVVVHNKDTIYLSEIRSAYVKLYGFNYKIYVNDEMVDINYDEDSVDLTEKAVGYLSNQQSCIIRIGNCISTIERFSLYSVDQSRVQNYIQEWEKTVKSGITLKPFSIDKNTLNTSEAFYLEGIFNYFVACQANGNDKGARYLDANRILKQFVPINSLGLCIRKIIAFKLNWVKTLSDLCESYGSNDDFDTICCFFKNEECDVVVPNEHGLSVVFIEDELQEIYDAILAFNRKDYDSVKIFLDKHDENMVSDPNLKDKILLLKYRMRMLSGDIDTAVALFDEILAEGFNR